MKTLLSLFVIITLFSACRKDRTCTCTDSTGATISQSTIPNSTKKDAKASCVSSTASGITCNVK